jgi:hypothetical protein
MTHPLREENSIEDECRSGDLHLRRKKFSFHDLLARISKHEAGEQVALRKDDGPLQQSLCDLGLLKLVTVDGSTIPEKTDLHLDDIQINSLGRHLKEELVAKFREELKKTGS